VSVSLPSGQIQTEALASGANPRTNHNKMDPNQSEGQAAFFTYEMRTTMGKLGLAEAETIEQAKAAVEPYKQLLRSEGA
jgi:hypothetical protein